MFTGISICEEGEKGDEEKIIAVNSIEKANKFYFFFLLPKWGNKSKKKVCVIWPRWCSILLKCSNVPSRLKIDICKKCEKFSSEWWQKSFFLSQNRNWKQLWHPKHLPLTLIKCAIFLNPRFIIFYVPNLNRNIFFYLQIFFWCLKKINYYYFTSIPYQNLTIKLSLAMRNLCFHIHTRTIFKTEWNHNWKKI